MANSVEVSVVPASEPVTTAEMKRYIKIDHSDENDDIDALVTAARVFVETFTRRALISQTLVFRSDEFPATKILLPNPPLVSVSSITYTDTAGSSQTWASSKYDVDQYSTPGRIEPAHGEAFPATRSIPNAVVVTYVAGYGSSASDVPATLRTAIKQLAAHWYEHREPVLAGAINEVPIHVERLLWQHRVVEVY